MGIMKSPAPGIAGSFGQFYEITKSATICEQWTFRLRELAGQKSPLRFDRISRVHLTFNTSFEYIFWNVGSPLPKQTYASHK